jgi:acyl carrier protein
MENLLVTVQEAFQSAFGVDPQTITMATTPGDVPAWDSMGHVALASSLESAFGLSFDVEDLMEMEDVEKIVRVVQGKLGKAQRAQV